MVERIRQILQTRQLSPTQFADALGLARPIISHVLSGRNKPSLEVVQKIIATFPDLSLPWLLSGQGPMLAAATTAVAPEDKAAPASNEPVPPPTPFRAKRAVPRATRTVADPAATSKLQPTQLTQPTGAELPPAVAQPVLAEAPRPASPTPAEAIPVPPLPTAVVSAAQNALPSSPVPASTEGAAGLLSAFAEPGKAIRRIVIFYHDGTFSAYQPEMPS